VKKSEPNGQIPCQNIRITEIRLAEGSIVREYLAIAGDSKKFYGIYQGRTKIPESKDGIQWYAGFPSMMSTTLYPDNVSNPAPYK